ncbi:hypothetical protein [Ectopseudomonas khazarica]|uniref:hypothetical protein n=1 Tax=Ectopseudomonas khazarica TaxID=2502979 RepID=UPI0037C638E5
MREEGLLNDAFNKVKDGSIEARWLLNQAGFNFEDSHPVSATQRACIAFAIAAATKASDPSHGPNEKLIEEAMAAKNLGEIKAVISKLPD